MTFSGHFYTVAFYTVNLYCSFKTHSGPDGQPIPIEKKVRKVSKLKKNNKFDKKAEDIPERKRNLPATYEYKPKYDVFWENHKSKNYILGLWKRTTRNQ